MTIVAATGRGVPSGANTNIQYNDSGVFGADANLTWNKATQLHTITGQEIISYNNSFSAPTSHYEHLRLDNTGTNSMIGFWFSGNNRSRISVTNNATMDIAVGGNNAAFSFKNGSAMTSLTERLYIYNQGLYTSYNGYFGQNVTMGLADVNAASALSNYGASAHKGLFVSSSTYTLANETFIYADPSTSASCVGTAAACSSYGDEGTCNTHSAVGCTWNAGSSCGVYNGNQAGCEGQAGCTWESVPCSTGASEEYYCNLLDDTWGGNCFWSTANSCSAFLSYETCTAQTGCYWEQTPCSTWNGDQSNCQNNGCTWDSASCSSATDETACLALDDAYGGSCSWNAGGSCSAFTDQSTCQAQSPCTWDQTLCSSANNTSQATCEAISGCTFLTSSCLGPTDSTSCTNQNNAYGGSCNWSTGNSCSVYGDETACNAQSGCSWDSGTNTCNGTYDYCDGSYYNGTCDGTGPYSCNGVYGSCSGTYNTGTCSGTGPSSCTGTYSYCAGNYYTSNCTGIYGVGCEGSSDCTLLTTSGSCAAESGCSWQTVQTLTLPQATGVNRSQTSREYSIVYVGTTGTVSIVPYSGDTIYQHGSSINLYKAGDRVWLHQHHLYSDCGTFSTYEDCNDFGSCTWNTPCAQYTSEVSCNAESGSGCSWDPGNSICIGAETCTGTYISSRPWFVHNLERGLNYVEKTIAYTLTELDDIVNVTANTVTITLPSAVSVHRKEFTIKNSGTGIVTINTTSSQTVDGLASGVITLASMDAITIQSTASGNWVII